MGLAVVSGAFGSLVDPEPPLLKPFQVSICTRCSEGISSYCLSPSCLVFSRFFISRRACFSSFFLAFSASCAAFRSSFLFFSVRCLSSSARIEAIRSLFPSHFSIQRFILSERTQKDWPFLTRRILNNRESASANQEQISTYWNLFVGIKCNEEGLKADHICLLG